RKRGRWAHAGIVALLLVNSFTSIALAGQAVVLVMRGDFRAERQLLDAYSWLNSHSQSRDLVLADFDNSNQIPQYARTSVFCGYINAVRFADKLKALQRFLEPETSNEFREQLIQQNVIQFVLLRVVISNLRQSILHALYKSRPVARPNSPLRTSIGS